MNAKRDALDRLLRSASQAPARPAGEASFALEARVMSSWRSTAQGGSRELFVVWLRRAAICAGTLAVASLAWNFSEQSSFRTQGDELAVADAAMRVGVDP